MQEFSEQLQPKLTKANWIKLCLEWEQSGERQESFCNKRKIHYNTFVYWRMRLKKETRPTLPATFSAVNIKSTPVSSFKIHLPNGIGFTIPSTMNKTELKLLFDLLGITTC